MAVWKSSVSPDWQLSPLSETGFIPSLPLTLFFNRASTLGLSVPLPPFHPSFASFNHKPFMTESCLLYASWAPRSVKMCSCWAFAALRCQHYTYRGTQLHPVCIGEGLALVACCPCSWPVPQAVCYVSSEAVPTACGRWKEKQIPLQPHSLTWCAEEPGSKSRRSTRKTWGPHLAPWHGSRRRG